MIAFVKRRTCRFCVASFPRKWSSRYTWSSSRTPWTTCSRCSNAAGLVPYGFSNTTRAPGREPVGVEGLHVRLERRRRQRDVVHEQGVPADLLTGPRDRVGQVAGVVGGEAVAREHQVLVHGREQLVVVQHVAHVIGEPGVVLAPCGRCRSAPTSRASGRPRPARRRPAAPSAGRGHRSRRTARRSSAACLDPTRQSTGRYVASSYG